MIAAMSSVQFVSNVACVRFLHRETVPGRVYAATAAILAGNILMVVFSSKSSPLYTVADLKAFYTRLPYIVYLAALAVGANPAHLPAWQPARWRGRSLLADATRNVARCSGADRVCPLPPGAYQAGAGSFDFKAGGMGEECSGEI